MRPVRKNEFNSIKAPKSSTPPLRYINQISTRPTVFRAGNAPVYIGLEAILVPGLDGVLVIGKVKGDHYVQPEPNIHAFALNQVEAGLRVALLKKCREVNASILKAISHNFAIVACGGNSATR